jgi:hypothetical protein
MQLRKKTGASLGALLGAVLAAFLLLPITLQATLVAYWHLQDTAKAPVLVVGRVLRVEKGQRNADASRKSQTDIFDMTAELDVLRSFTHAGETIAANRIRVGYPGITPNGSPYPLPILEPGQVLVLPLQENRNPATVVWRMTVESGEGFIVPTAAVLADEGPLPTTGMRFLLREIANALARGTPAEMAGMGRYLAFQDLAHDVSGTPGGLTGDLMPLLESTIGTDRQGWAKVATNIMADHGTPRPTVAELFSDKPQPGNRPFQQSMLLVQAALRKLGQSPETDALLIRTWIADAPWHAWGSGMSLVEYAKNPVTTETMRKALNDDASGSSSIAWTLVRNGNRDLIPEALARALKVADRPAGDPAELQSAAMLLHDYGSEQDLDRVVALVRKYQTVNRDFYMGLWQSAAVPRVLAVALSDRTIVPHSSTDGFRVCDYALADLEGASGQNFGSRAATTVAQRDGAIARAQAWLKSQGITN